jgi:carboxypeptidase Q
MKQLTLVLVLLMSSARAGDARAIEALYSDAAARIIEAAMTNEGAWRKLAHLCDRIGHRLSGSPQLEQAIEWARREMEKDGLDNVRALPVEVPHWVRGEESGRIVTPVERPLHLLGLGGTISTPPEGLRAPVVVVRSFDELDELGRERVEGRVVVFNVPFEGYGPTVRYRTEGAIRSAALGAVGTLVRSVTPVSLQTPHTGAMRYDSRFQRLPAAAVTIEDAELLQRLYDSGDTVEVDLLLSGRTLPPAQSANVVGEIVGAELPDEIVLLGGHIDSWDVGQGAHDNGAGVVVSMEAARLLIELGLRPRRTLRIVLFTNEENGLAGSRAYRQWVGDRIHLHAAAVEIDAGAERPIGFGLGEKPGDPEATRRGLERAEAIGRLLDPIGADLIRRGGGGADISTLMRDGVPGLGLLTVGERYFHWHHSSADTLDKVDPGDLRSALAAAAVMAYVLADMPGRLFD